MSMTNGWVPVALASSIEAGTSAGSVVGGAEVVVWRDNKGVAHVWEDRCPHRGMRMSFGFVRGDHIACLYHGWAYDTAGQCQHIPAHPDLEVPKTIKISTYATEERDGLIWTCLSDDADIAGLPEAGSVASPVRSLYLDCPLDAVRPILARTTIPDDSGMEHPAAIEDVLSNCLILTAGATRLLIGCQAMTSQRSALHVVALGATEAGAPARKALARWAERLRLTLEAADETRLAEVA